MRGQHLLINDGREYLVCEFDLAPQEPLVEPMLAPDGGGIHRTEAIDLLLVPDHDIGADVGAFRDKAFRPEVTSYGYRIRLYTHLEFS